MRIRYRATKHQIEVKDETGRRLVAAGIADEVEPKAKKRGRKPARSKAELPKAETPRRTYRRRDLQAEPAAVTEPAGHYQTRAELPDGE